MEHPIHTFDSVTSTCNLPIMTQSPPLPPNWIKHYQNTIISQANYKLFPVDSRTSEYITISELFSQHKIKSLEQIVNPTLWSRFVNARKDMIKSKSDNFELLSQLGLSEEEMMASYYYSLNFVKHPSVAAVPYNDNIALLFHCTRNQANIESILLHGLDERMCKINGLLGRGVYFTDNPQKAVKYDGCDGIMFIFAVLLGDCLYLDRPLQPTVLHRVKEPEKWPQQKRTVNDLFFDSIIAKPTSSNEYVVYNRYQCYPLYKISYSHQFALDIECPAYLQSRNCLSIFNWTINTENIPLPNMWVTSGWPFYAKTIFARMGGA